MPSLEDRFKNAKAEYHFLKESCEAQVVQWRWACGQRIEPTPYYFKLHRFSKGSWLEDAPERQGGGVYQYGFDKENRLIVTRQPLNWPIKVNYYEEFFQYDGHIINGTLYHYDETKQPINVTRKIFEGTRFIQFERCTNNGIQREIYHYRANKLVQIETWVTNANELIPWGTVKFTYDSLGRLDRIGHLRTPDSEYHVYRRPRQGETMKALSRAIQQHYVDVIPKVISSAGIKDRIYCLILVYDLSNDPLPIGLALGTENERETWIAKYGRGAHEALSWIWSYGANFIHFENPELNLEPYSNLHLRDISDLFNQQCRLMGTSEPGIALINNIAAELMQLDWSAYLNVTDDFVVYGSEFGSNDQERNMAASIPSAILNSLREKGYF